MKRGKVTGFIMGFYHGKPQVSRIAPNGGADFHTGCRFICAAVGAIRAHPCSSAVPCD
jgi:hypothetical protein